jgi:hypothetical protein
MCSLLVEFDSIFLLFYQDYASADSVNISFAEKYVHPCSFWLIYIMVHEINVHQQTFFCNFLCAKKICAIKYITLLHHDFPSSSFKI